MNSAQNSIQTLIQTMRRNVSLWLAAIALCVAFALSHSFSSMANYDDESYIMMTIKTFLDGDQLYSETYTQYGPSYYMLQQPIHGWLGVPITHDIVRLKTVATWILIGLLSGIVVARLTGKNLIGIAAMMLSVLFLEKLGLEPAHPQEVVALLAMLCLLLMNSQNRWLLLAAGVCAAVAGLAKLNVGATAAAACLFAGSMASLSSSRFSRSTAFIGSAIAVGMPAGIFAMIAKKSFASGQWATLAWPAIIFFSATLICFVAWQHHARPSNDGPKLPPWWSNSFLVIALGGLIGSIGVIAWSVAHGNSLHEILHGVVLQHSFMADSFYHPIRVELVALPFILLVAFLLPSRLLRIGNDSAISLDQILMILPSVVLAISIFKMGLDCCSPLIHGLAPRGAALFLASVGPAMMPILLLKKADQFRLTLAMIGCLSPLMAFPVPGTQVSLGTLPIFVGLIVATFDASKLDTPAAQLPRLFCKKLVWISAALLLVSSSVFAYRWTNNTALDQPGCRWVKIDSSRAAHDKAVAEAIRSTNSNWLVFDTHNHNRFFFWTDKQPLTSISPTFWPAMLTETQQAKIKAAAEKAGVICVVKQPNERVELQDYAPALEKEFFESWELIDQVGEWQIGIRAK